MPVPSTFDKRLLDASRDMATSAIMALQRIHYTTWAVIGSGTEESVLEQAASGASAFRRGRLLVVPTHASDSLYPTLYVRNTV